jgi:hypothetical protein
MTTWPSTNKAVTTTTDQASDRIDLARTDINKTIANVNDIIDIFNIPASPTDNYILKYNASTGVFDMEEDTGGDTVTGTQEMWIPADLIYPQTGNSPCANIAAVRPAGSTLVVRSLNFDASTDENAQFHVAMPKKWNEGSLTFKVYWTATGGTPSDGVSWKIGAIALDDNDGISGVLNEVTIDDTYINSYKLHETAESSSLTLSGTTLPNDILFVKITRDTGNANDTFTSDALLMGVKIYYTTESGTDD